MLNYQQISDDLKEAAAKISRSVPQDSKPSLYDKFDARKAIRRAVAETGNESIADKAADQVIPLRETLSFSNIEQVAEAIAKGRDGIYDKFGDLMVDEWDAY